MNKDLRRPALDDVHSDYVAGYYEGDGGDVVDVRLLAHHERLDLAADCLD